MGLHSAGRRGLWAAGGRSRGQTCEPGSSSGVAPQDERYPLSRPHPASCMALVVHLQRLNELFTTSLPKCQMTLRMRLNMPGEVPDASASVILRFAPVEGVGPVWQPPPPSSTYTGEGTMRPPPQSCHGLTA